jgi:broad specificity phosphatase PhoE
LNITEILSSDLPRALRTAEAIAAATGAPIQTSDLLQERNFGDWRGQRYDDISIDPHTTQETPPGGESVSMFEERVARAFEHVVRVRSLMTGGNLAVVTHGLVLRAMLAKHARLSADMDQPAQMDNTSVSIIDAQSPHAATLINCIRHLDKATHSDPQGLSGG